MTNALSLRLRESSSHARGSFPSLSSPPSRLTDSASYWVVRRAALRRTTVAPWRHYGISRPADRQIETPMEQWASGLTRFLRLLNHPAPSPSSPLLIVDFISVKQRATTFSF